MFLLFLSCIWVLIARDWAGAKASVDVLSINHIVPQYSRTDITCNVTGESFEGWTDPFGRAIFNDSSVRLHVVNEGYRHDLVFKYVHRTDRGTYWCRGKLHSSNVTLYVEYRPYLIQSQSTRAYTMWVPYGGRVELKCKFTGYPIPAVAIVRDDTGRNITSGVTEGVGSIIYRFTMNHWFTMSYTCKATNKRGNARHHMRIRRAGPPSVPSYVSVNVGCDSATVSWGYPLSTRGSSVISYRIEIFKDRTFAKEEDVYTSYGRHKEFHGLEEGTDYAVIINARNHYGSSNWKRADFTTKKVCGKKSAGTMFTSSIISLAAALIITMTTM